MKDNGLSARTINFCRQIAVAFVNWCVKTGRIETNPLTVIPKLDESRDRRRVRRPLTDDELRRLLAAAEPRGRKLWYLMAVLAGLRKSELGRLRWADIDLNQGSITVRNGKAKRIDMIPIHPQLIEELQRRRDEAMSTPQTKVFPQIVTDVTRRKDFLRAGIAREQVVVGDDGKPVMIGKGEWLRPKTRIVTEDAEGRVIDLHAMRTTLGTMLARQGAKPQVAREIMRHSDYQTTLTHYTMLGLSDTAGAINEIPDIGTPETISATGTMSATADPQQSERESVQFHATTSDQDTTAHQQSEESNHLESLTLSDEMQRDATSSLEGYRHRMEVPHEQQPTGGSANACTNACADDTYSSKT